MSNIATLTTTENGANSLIDINNNFSSLNASKLEKASPIITVGVQGQYSTIQAALNAAPSNGCIIQLLDPEYDLTSGLTFKTPDTVIVGASSDGTVIAADGSVVTTMIAIDSGATAQTIGRCGLKNISLYQTNATKQGVGLDASNMSLNIYDNLSFTNFGTAIKMNDTANYTYFNRFRDIKIFLCNNGIDMTSTNPVNDNMFDNIRISLNVSGSGFGLKITNGLANAFYSFDVDLSATIGPGNTGVILQSAGSEVLVRHNVFVNPYVENCGTLMTIATARENIFVGGAFVWGAQTSSGVTDSGTGTQWYGTRVDTALNTITSLNKFGSPITVTDLSSSGAGSSVFQNNANFAHGTNPLVEIKYLNASDSSALLKLTHVGKGLALDVKGGTVLEPVTNTILTGNANDYLIDSIVASGSSTFFRLSSDASRNITGIAGYLNGTSSPLIDGRQIFIRNSGVNTIVFTHQDTNSLPANRFIFSGGANVSLASGSSLSLMYDATTARWFDIN